jgi:hypothetical protein
MRKILLAALMLLWGQGGGAEESWGLTQLMQAMAQVESSSARFTETKYLSVLTTPLTLSGKLSYVRPGRVEKHVLVPYDERLTVENDVLTLEKNGKNRTLDLPSHPVAWAFVESIRATLSGDLALLQRFYRARFDGDHAAWRLILEPLDSEITAYVQSITIDGSDNHIDRIELREAGGDRSVMVIMGRNV